VIAEPAFGPQWSASLRRGTEAELRSWLEVAQDACDAADDIARRHFRRDLTIETKPDRTFVTQADTSIERLIRERLADAFPDHGLIGEEYGVESGDASVRWYIDPIDGTHNFIRGVPLFGTLLGVERDGELQASVMSAPALDERWWAHRGGGAWARDRSGEARRIGSAPGHTYLPWVCGTLIGGEVVGRRALLADGVVGRPVDRATGRPDTPARSGGRGRRTRRRPASCHPCPPV